MPFASERAREEPRRVARAQPHRQTVGIAGAVAERPDAQAHDLERPLVRVKAPKRLAEDLGDAVQRVRPDGIVGADPLAARVEAGHVVRAGENDAADARLTRGLEDVVRSGDVGR